MKNILVILIILLGIQSKSIAQNESDKAHIIERTNTQVLNEIAEKSGNSYYNLLKEAHINGIPVEIINSKNEKGYLSGFDLIGNPVYDFDDNVSAAKEVSESIIENIETPYYPDEDLVQQWIDSLLSCQFTMEEIKSGLAKEVVDRLQV